MSISIYSDSKSLLYANGITIMFSYKIWTLSLKNSAKNWNRVTNGLSTTCFLGKTECILLWSKPKLKNIAINCYKHLSVKELSS